MDIEWCPGERHDGNFTRVANTGSGSRRHPFVVRLRYWFDGPADTWLVMDYAPRGTLDSHLERRSGRRLPIAHARLVSAELASALLALHAAGVVHRDLKPANCLLEVKPVSLKICDFGPRLSVITKLELDAWSIASSRDHRDAVDVAVRDSFATPSFRAGLARTLPRQHLQRSVSLRAADDDDTDSPKAVHVRPPLRRQMTTHVVTRWYRAPELLLRAPQYNSCLLYTSDAADE